MAQSIEAINCSHYPLNHVTAAFCLLSRVVLGYKSVEKIKPRDFSIRWNSFPVLPYVSCFLFSLVSVFIFFIIFWSPDPTLVSGIVEDGLQQNPLHLSMRSLLECIWHSQYIPLKEITFSSSIGSQMWIRPWLVWGFM